MPRVDVFPGAYNRQVRHALRPVAVKIVVGTRFDFVLVHSRVRASNGRAVAFRADFSVAPQDFNLFRPLDVAHRIDDRGHVP